MSSTSESSATMAKVIDPVEDIDLKQLSFTELVNRANKNKDLIDEAGLEFARISQQCVKINGRRCVKGIFQLTHKVKVDCIEIYDRDLCYKVLRNFGSFITKLVIDFDGLEANDQFNKYMPNDINAFCANSLIELELLSCRKITFEKLINPFSEVQRVCLKNSYLEFNGKDLYRLFPSVNRLELLANNVAYKGCIEQSFTDLQHLAVQLSDRGFSNEHLFAALCQNQQLSSLHVVAHVDSTLIQAISEATPFLQCLHLHIISYEFKEEDEAVHFRTVEKLLITMDGGPFINLPIWFTQLAELEVTINGALQDEDLSKFIARNEKLTKLSIIAPSWNRIELSDSDMNVLSAKLKCLTDFTLQRCNISIEAAVNMMKSASMLRVFRFSVTIINKDKPDLANKDQPELVNKDSLLLQLENKWKLTIDNNSYLCERQ